MYTLRSTFLTLMFLLTPILATANPTSGPQTSKPAAIKDASPAKEAQASTVSPVVVFTTSVGTYEVELYPDKAPKTVNNFLSYVEAGFYSDVIFHRIIPNFVVQTGGFHRNYERKETQAPIVNESNNGLKNLRGTLSMARTSMPDSGTSQFFISLVDNPSLDWKPGSPGYAVFGKVIKGMEVVDKMAQAPQGRHKGLFANAPNEPIFIESAKIKSNK